MIRTSATTSVPKPTSGLLSERSTQPLGGVKQALLSDTLSSSDSQSQLPSKRGRLFSALKPSQHQPAADLEQAAHDTASAENGASLSSQHEPAADLDQAPRLNVKRRTSRLSFSTDFDHPPAKKYQYFLSHKKSHSELGLVPGQVAKNFHDSLELLGHVGWMDVDNLGKINQGELRAAIAECASMLVILNDETPDSEWCRFEWKMAQEFDVPVKVIVDMELCSKKRALSLLTELRHENMLRYSLLEYTERYRRDTLAALSQFLHDVAPLDKHGKLQKPKRSWRSARSSYSDPLMFGQEDSVEQHVLHPLYETYTLVGGAPARPPTSGVWLAYVYLANSSSAICALTWLLGVFLLPEGSDVFVSYHVEVTSALWMCCIPQLSASMMRLLRSEDMMRVLEMIEQQQTGEELSKSLHVRDFPSLPCPSLPCHVLLRPAGPVTPFHAHHALPRPSTPFHALLCASHISSAALAQRNSGRAAKLGFQFAAVFQAMVIAIVVCMFADPQYMGEGVPSWVQCVSMSSIAVFSTLFAMTVVSAVSGASQHGLIHSISRIQVRAC